MSRGRERGNIEGKPGGGVSAVIVYPYQEGNKKGGGGTSAPHPYKCRPEGQSMGGSKTLRKVPGSSLR